MKFARVVAGAAVFAFIGLSTNLALAQRGGKGGGGGAEPSAGDEIQMAVGESKTLSAKGVKNYSDSTPGIADIRLTPDGTQFIVNGKKPGQTTLLLIKDDGSQIQYPITVSSKSIAGVEKDLQQLTEGISGVHLRRVGSRFFLEGSVSTDADLKRVQQIASLYPGQVESLVTVGSAGADRKLLVRLDFFFVQYDRTASYTVGLGWPAAIGGVSNNQLVVQSQMTYDFIGKATTTAQASVINQPLPELDIAMQHGWAKILKQSTVVTSNGQEASFQSGGEQNFLATVGLTASLVTVKFGTNVTVLPRFDSASKELEVKLDADVADLSDPAAGSTIPSKNETKLATLVTLKLGQALVLSGIRTRTQRHSVSGLPGLSQIPVLGLLFGKHGDVQEDIEGAIFIVPSIIETVPKSSIEVIKNALSTYDEFSGEIEKVDSFNKTPPSAK